MLRRRQHHRRDHRLLELLDARGIRHLRGAVDLVHLAVGGRHPIQHARRRRHQVHVELALEPLLHDLHVKQAQEPAAEAEAERRGRLRLEEQRRVVEAQLLQRLAQLRVLVAFDRVQAREDHRPQFLEPGIRLRGRPRRLRHRVADLRVVDLLDPRDDEADLARGELVDDQRLRQEHADLLDRETPARSPSGASSCPTGSRRRSSARR